MNPKPSPVVIPGGDAADMMPFGNVAQVLKNLDQVLDCIPLEATPTNSSSLGRLRYLSALGRPAAPAFPVKTPADFPACLEPGVQNYCWDDPRVDPVNPGSLEGTLRSRQALTQLTADLNRLVEEGSLPPRLRQYILAGQTGEIGPCQDGKLPRDPVVRLNLPQGITQGMITRPSAPFAAPSLQLSTMLPVLRELVTTTQSEVRFSNYTGAVRTLRGNLSAAAGLPPAGPAYGDIAQNFVEKYAEALVGVPTAVEKDAATRSYGRTTRLRQIRDGIPVYGGVLIASFDRTDRMTYANNSFYPIPPDAPPFNQRFRVGQREAFEVAKQYVLERLLEGVEQLIAMPGKQGAWRPDLAVAPADTHGDNPDEHGKVIFPALLRDPNARQGRDRIAPEAPLTQDDPDAAQGEPAYLPAWLVAVTETETGKTWTVVVDAERTEGSPDERVLAASENLRGAAVQSIVAATVAAALGLAAETQEELANTPSGDLTDAPYFDLKTARPAGGKVTYVAAALNTGDPDAPRYASTYFHLKKARERFATIIQDAWPDTPGQRPALPGEAARLPVHFELQLADTEFTWDSKTLRLGRGNPALARPIGDPTTDPEVLYHEFTHAVLDIVQPDLHMQHKTQFHGAIDEGLAFYYACSISDQLVHALAGASAAGLVPYRWAKVARGAAAWTAHGYRDLERAAQKPDHDFFQVYGVFPAYKNLDDPDGRRYACGMVCARMLWDVRRVLGPALADAVILRAVHLAGGVQSDLETLAEAILHVEREMAGDAGRGSHESALRLVFSSRGILADSPINDLRVVTINGQQAVLAASEDTDPAGGKSGCLISLDDGVSWTTLGTGGPGQVAALATLQTGPNQVSIWAATEAWAPHAGAPAQPLVFRYDLTTDGAGKVVTDGTWAALPPLGIVAGILSMAGLARGAETPWLFLGTERGVYKFDGTSWPAPTTPGGPPAPNWGDMPIFDLEIAALDGAVKLLAATQSGPRVLVINDPAANDFHALTLDQGYMKNTWSLEMDLFPCLTFTLATDGAGQSHLFAGAADRDLYHWDPAFVPPAGSASKKWITLAAPGAAAGQPARSRPIFRLRPAWSAGSWEFWAGTDDGVYHKVSNNAWAPDNNSASAAGETLVNTSAVAMCQTASALLIGTGQRGIWRQGPAGQWSRITQGLPRIGRLSDALTGGRFMGDLAPHDTGAHVLDVTQPFASLSVTPSVTPGGSLATIALFYVSPDIDLTSGHLAGLQVRTLTPQAGSATQTLGGGPSGFYLFVVQAGATATQYVLQIALT